MAHDKTLKVLLVEDEPAECEAISSYIEQTEGIRLIGATSNINKAFADVCDCLPDAIILDLELHKGTGDGICFMEMLCSSEVFRPFILVTTNNISETIHQKIRRAGADFIILKSQDNYGADYVVDFLLSMKSTIFSHKKKYGFPQASLTLNDQEELAKRISRKIDAELDLIGINPRVLGRKYLTDAIQLIINKPQANFCNTIAKKYGKSSQSIDHAMSNAIKRAWSTTPIEELLRLYTAKINVEKGYPTYTEFVYYYARKIKNDCL